MSKVAILSDIHANYGALLAVLNQAEVFGVDYFFVLGDSIGYYYDSGSVINCLKSLPATIIAGNHERMFLGGLNSDIMRVSYRKKYGSGFDLAYDNLNSSQIEWIADLKFSERSTKYLKVFDCFHGSPWDVDAYIYPDASKSIFDACRTVGVNYTLTGHTHYAVVKRLSSDQLFINPGSVGQPRDVSGYASWCTIDTVDNTVSLHKTSYCLDKVLNQCRTFDPHNLYMQEVLTR